MTEGPDVRPVTDTAAHADTGPTSDDPAADAVMDAADPTDQRGSAYVSADFMFGTLATDDLRLAQIRAASAGVHHGHDLEPPDPRPGDAVRISVTVGDRVHADHVRCYYTTDGSDPAGDRGRSTNGWNFALECESVAWDTLSWAYTEKWSGRVPPQPAGTLVRYRIQAWAELDRDGTWATETAGLVAGERPV